MLSPNLGSHPTGPPSDPICLRLNETGYQCQFSQHLKCFPPTKSLRKNFHSGGPGARDKLLGGRECHLRPRGAHKQATRSPVRRKMPPPPPRSSITPPPRDTKIRKTSCGYDASPLLWCGRLLPLNKVRPLS